MFFISINGQRRPVLGDSGCTGSCVSLDYYRKNPSLKDSFVPKKSCGTAINGSDVKAIGEVKLDFSLEETPMTITCKVIKGLMDPIVLGWDWMFKYSVAMDPAKGYVHYGDGMSAPLIELDLPRMGSYYRAAEDITLPPYSKVHTRVEFVPGKDTVGRSSPTVVTEPFNRAGSSYCAARTCAVVKNDLFMTEFINCSNQAVKIPAGEVIGYAEVAEETAFGAATLTTEMTCEFNPSCEKDPIVAATTETSSAAEVRGKGRSALRHCPSAGASFGGCQMDSPNDNIPPGAKPLRVDLSQIAEDARPYEGRLRDLLVNKRKKAFSVHDRDYGRTNLIQYRANLKDPDQNPIAQPPYRTRPEMREVIDKQAHEMIADGLVGHSTSPYSAPILLERKKCGGWRFLTDFRKVNDSCNKVVFPLPRIEDSIQRLEKPRFFSSMDLTKGFWQIPIHPDDRKYFAFSTESMHLEYLVAPMGAKNSPSCLSALMQLVLRGLPIQHVISYLDDILVADTNMEDHIRHLDQVLTALEKAGLKLNPSKCAFARDSVICLGHKLSREGVSPDPANVEKIKSWKPPNNLKKLRAFLGLTGYYRQFVKGYSEIARPLTDLTREDCKWVWAEAHQKAFETLRDALVSEQVMAYPDFERPFVVKTDASLTAIGYILSQEIDKKERVISYGSKKLSAQQQRWSTYDREFFALIAGVRANAHYLRHARFVVITDHRPLLAWRKVDAKKDPTGRRTRWAIELDNYDFDLIYKAGKAHSDADAMSRRGDEDDELAEDTEEFYGLALLESWREDLDARGDDLFLLDIGDESDSWAANFHVEEEEQKRLRQEQDADSIISEVKGFISQRRRLPRKFPGTWYKCNGKWLVIKDGILYRRHYSDTAHAEVLQAVIPTSMVNEVLDGLHGSQWAGHPKVEKMLLQVRRYAVWPTLVRDVKEKVKNCCVCDQLREQVPKPQTPLQPIVAHRVFDHVMCDLISFDVPSSGYKYVLVFKDVFSGFIRCYKLRDKTAAGVTKCFEDLVCFLGPPRLLTSDNGGEFIAETLKTACKVLGVEKRTSVPYRPQSQGNVERQNRTLIKDLQHRLLQYGRSWSEHLPYAEWLHNTTPFAKTKMTPYFVFFGREPYLPLFTEQPAPAPVNVKDQRFLEDMKCKVKLIHDEANRRAEEKRRKEADLHDRRVKHAPFKEGDQVWERVEVRRKLDPKWSGPIEVKSRRRSSSGEPGTTYVCKRPDGSECRRNYEQLKRVNAEFDRKMEMPVEPKPSRPQTRSLAALFAFACDETATRVPEVLPPSPPALVPPPPASAPAPPPSASLPAPPPPASLPAPASHPSLPPPSSAPTPPPSAPAPVLLPTSMPARPPVPPLPPRPALRLGVPAPLLRPPVLRFPRPAGPVPAPGIGGVAMGPDGLSIREDGSSGSAPPSGPSACEATRYSDWPSTFSESGAAEHHIAAGGLGGEFTDDEDEEAPPKKPGPDLGSLPLSPIGYLRPIREFPGEKDVIMETGEASTLRNAPTLSPCVDDGMEIDETAQAGEPRPPRSSSPKRPITGPPGVTPQPSNRSGNSPFYTPLLRPLLPERDDDLDTPAMPPAAPQATAAFKSVRRRIHMPPDTINHPANPFASLRPIDEIAPADAQLPRPTMNRATGNSAGYFVSAPSGRVPVPRVAIQPPTTSSSDERESNPQVYASQDVRVKDNATGITLAKSIVSQRDDEGSETAAASQKSLRPRDAGGKAMKRK